MTPRLRDGLSPTARDGVVTAARRRAASNDADALSALLAALRATDPETSAQAWMDEARCQEVDPEIFFPEKGGSTREAKFICFGCEVRPKCLDYALDHDERFGVWGGTSERERRKLRRAPSARGSVA